MPRVKRVMAFVVLGMVGVLLIEAGYFYWALTRKNATGRADAIVVFNGSQKRVAAGYELAGNNHAPVLVISPASAKKLEGYDRKYGLGPGVTHVVEPLARTTFENALLTGHVIEKKHFRSVILVTSFEHLPRAFLLLQVMLLGKGVHIGGFKVQSGCFKNGGVNWAGTCFKRYYNEMMELWGSLFEGVVYGINGKLPEKSLNKRPVTVFLKSVLLFEVS